MAIARRGATSLRAALDLRTLDAAKRKRTMRMMADSLLGDESESLTLLRIRSLLVLPGKGEMRQSTLMEMIASPERIGKSDSAGAMARGVEPVKLR